PRKPKIRKESDMVEAVEHHLKRKAKVVVGREVKFGRGRLDLVAYDKNEKILKIIEGKLHSRPTSPGRTFGQLVTYLATMRGRIPQFLDAASKKLPMRYGRWMEATSNGKKIRVTFYVALTEKA